MSESTMLVDPTKTSTGLDNRKLGMWLFLVTEVMLFSALIGGMPADEGAQPGRCQPRPEHARSPQSTPSS